MPVQTSEGGVGDLHTAAAFPAPDVGCAAFPSQHIRILLEKRAAVFQSQTFSGPSSRRCVFRSVTHHNCS